MAPKQAMKATKTKAMKSDKAMKSESEATKTKAMKSDGPLRLNFKFETGAVIEQDVEGSNSIASVLRQLCCPPGSTLSFNDRKLDERRALSEYTIQKDSTLLVTFLVRSTTPEPWRCKAPPVVYVGPRPWWMSEAYYVFSDGS